MKSSAPALHAVSLSSPAAAFANVPDPRREASVRYPLSAILAMTVAAILSNHLSVLAISEWAARQHAETLTLLGFPTTRTPCQSTLQRLFAKLDNTALGQVLAATVALVPRLAGTGPQGVAIDGKAQRGRLRFPGGGGPVHALSTYCHATGLVLAHESIDAPRHTERGDAELSVTPTLLARLDWSGRVLTGDALFCQRAVCQQVMAAGGDYLVSVKQNQRRLYDDIALLFDPPAGVPTLPLTDRREAETLDYGHGRTRERRRMTASTDLVGYLAWPGQAQVLRLERTWHAHDHRHRSVGYAVTSLGPDRADPAQLLALKREHWQIENRLHRAKDVNLAEDASLIHAGQGPQVMALLRDAAISVLHAAGIRQVAARLRHNSQHPEEAVALVLGTLVTHA